MNFSFLKKFFIVFFLSYILIFSTKVLFYFYLEGSFSNYSLKEVFYALLWGYRFDMAMAGIVAFLSSFLDWHKKAFAIVSSLLLVLILWVQIGDIFYFYDSSRHVGYEVSDVFVDMYSLILTALNQHTLLTVLLIVFTPLIFIFTFRKLMNFEVVALDRFYIPKKILIILIALFFARGMTFAIPLNPWQSNEIGENKLATLALNASYNILYVSLNKHKKIKKQKITTMNEVELKKYIKRLYSDSNLTISKPSLEEANIVFFFLESWSGVNLKSYGYSKVTTPFFDNLLKKSIRPKAMLASGHRTTEGLYASLVSQQNPLGKTIAKSNLENFDYTSIIHILKKKYIKDTAFFQGTNKKASGTGAFVQILGFDDSYGTNDVIKRIYEENSWGVHDPDLYNFALEKMTKMKTPFIVGINGSTTHDDKIPKAIEPLNLSEDKAYNKQLNALHFSDMALKEFILEVEKKYPNTLFILVADHCGRVEGTAFENYLIPFALYHKDLESKYYDTYLSQRDIAPTLYDLLIGDYKKDKMPFSGKSLFSDDNFFADFYHNGNLGFVSGHKILNYNIYNKKSKCYNINKNTFKEIPRTCTKEDEENLKSLLSFTQYSQELLFDGKTALFKKNLE